MLHGECKECGRNSFLTNDYECGKCSTEKTKAKVKVETVVMPMNKTIKAALNFAYEKTLTIIDSTPMTKGEWKKHLYKEFKKLTQKEIRYLAK